MAGSLIDGGARETLSTGAMREPATGKGRYDLISPVMMRRLAQHYENGALKYATRNWEKGLDDSRCFDSAQRHMWQWLSGDVTEDHLAAAIWNLSCLMHYEEHLPNTKQRDLKMPWRLAKTKKQMKLREELNSETN